MKFSVKPSAFGSLGTLELVEIIFLLQTSSSPHWDRVFHYLKSLILECHVLQKFCQELVSSLNDVEVIISISEYFEY